jgi:hypothetical protein
MQAPPHYLSLRKKRGEKEHWKILEFAFVLFGFQAPIVFCRAAIRACHQPNNKTRGKQARRVWSFFSLA